VDYLHAKSAALPKTVANKISFESFHDLHNEMIALLKNNQYDWVIHAAAVSDYSVENTAGKISSEADTLTLKLKRNPKLLNMIKELSPHAKLVGFKLTSAASEKIITEKVSQQFEQAGCDLVVHNDMIDINKGIHTFSVYTKNLKKQSVQNTQELSFLLLKNMIEGRSL